MKARTSTFGHGLAAELSQKLYSLKKEDRLSAVHDLVQNWITRRMTLLHLTEAEKQTLQKSLDKKRDEGMKALKGFQKEGHTSFAAPSFMDGEECAACNGATGRKWELRKKP